MLIELHERLEVSAGVVLRRILVPVTAILCVVKDGERGGRAIIRLSQTNIVRTEESYDTVVMVVASAMRFPDLIHRPADYERSD